MALVPSPLPTTARVRTWSDRTARRRRRAIHYARIAPFIKELACCMLTGPSSTRHTVDTTRGGGFRMQSWHIRQATTADRAFLERLAPRLAVGIPPWRSAELMRATMRRFLL